MATEAQTAANRRNAESSTGPRTEEGKSRSSRNAVTFGIYSAADFVLPEDNGLYHRFCENFQKELSPKGPIEQTLAAEIVHAAWRLRRCAVIESNLVDPECDFQLDPMVNPATAPLQQSVDRARAQSHRVLHRASVELRRLQAEREIRTKLPRTQTPESNTTKRTQSEAANPSPIARSQPCPCGSGTKYKRCCGRSATGLLNTTARQAA
jgi:hypothetical protein